MSTGQNTKSSNRVGTRYAFETSLGVVDPSAVWTPVEINTFSDFGANVTTVARTPINASRQRRKGVVTDVEASGSYNMDLTQGNMYDFLPGFLFAAWTITTEAATTAVTATGFSVADETEWAAGALISSTGHTVIANNGVFVVTGTAVGEVQAAGLSVDASAGAIKRVGVVGGSGDLDIDASVPAFPQLTSTTLDFTTQGLTVGQWLFIGGDGALSRFVDTNNNGFARIYSISANALTFDRTSGTMVTETGTGLSIELYYGDFLKNEDNPDDIVSYCYQFERTLATSPTLQLEYLKGCVPNTLTFNMSSADKVTLDLGFVAQDADYSETSLKAGTRPDIVDAPAFNTSSDFSRLVVSGTNITGGGVFLQEYTLEVNNNVQPVKALGTLGNFDLIEGDFQVSGQFTAYYANNELVQAVRNNDDIQVDFVFVKDNAGLLFDIPLATLGEGRINVEKDAPITIPLSKDAARDPYYTYTMSVLSFTYLPDLADV